MHNMNMNMTRRQLALAAATSAALVALPVQAQSSAGALNLAMVGEPPTLDPVMSTADLVITIMQHVYEPLFTWDANWRLVPMLASAMPKISGNGLRYQIPVRQGVKFHDGRTMAVDDVVASLERWLAVSPRGKGVAGDVESVKAVGNEVEIVLKKPYAPLIAQLAMPNAAIMPKDTLAPQLTKFIGTGPFQFKERRPDQYVLLTRFDAYSARSEVASGLSGKRLAMVSELRFVPVPNANTRVEGALSGQFHYADQLPLEAMPRLERQSGVSPVLQPGFGFPYLVFNTREGVMANQGMRRAVQIAFGQGDALSAAFGDKRFYTVEANHFPKNTPFFSDSGSDRYNQANAVKAKSDALAAGYKGEPIRMMTSRQFEFHHTMMQVMADQLRKAGFTVDLQVVDWASLVQRRGDSKLWDVFMTHSPMFPEPTLSPPQLGEGAPGWWGSPAKDKALDAFNQQPDPSKRPALWAGVQQVVADEVPYINMGKFSALGARSDRLAAYEPRLWPAFWNVSLNR
jgi:peptide/nickel transport system substrate-binding protein